MYKNVLRLAVFMLLVSFAAAATSKLPSWTFMVYLDGDNDLESAAIEDFFEMSDVGSDANVNILVLMDRIGSYDTSNGNWTGTRRGIVNKGDAPGSSWGKSMGELNMGDPDNLVDFITWGAENYPASNYAVILWNHGGGWRDGTSADKNPLFKDVCYDDTNGEDCLYTYEVRAALEEVAAAGINPKLIGFDACLMGMVEVAYEVRNNADVMVASPYSEPGDGWPYTEILSELTGRPSMTAAELGSIIVDEYYASYGNDYTMAALDLSKMDGLASSVNGLAHSLMDSWDSNVAACIGAASNVIRSLSSAVIAEAHGYDWSDGHGLAINFPTNGADYDYNSSIIQFPGVSDWDDFLDYYDSSLSRTWVADAAKDAQYYEYSEYKDLYDFCENLINSYDGFQVSGSDMTFSMSPDSGVVSPDTCSYTLSNYTVDDVAWQVSVSADWLVCNSGPTGILASNGSTTLVFSVSPEMGMPETGSESCTITITNLNDNTLYQFDISVVVETVQNFEQFSGDFDLGNTCCTFAPSGTANDYSGSIVSVTGFASDTSNATEINLGDDECVKVSLSNNISFYGHLYSEIYVCSNGYIGFGNNYSTYSSSYDNFFASPKVAGLQTDLNPSSQGTVSYEELSDRVVVSWEGVPAYGANSANSFQIELFYSGIITITWLDINVSDVILGLSSGNTPNDIQEANISDFPATVPAELPAEIAGDVNRDGWVNIDDLGELAKSWLVEYDSDCPDADIAGDDCFVNSADFAVLAATWGNTIYAIVPDVTGDDYSAAIAAIEAGEFGYKLEYSYSDNVLEGLVISTSPAAGEEVLAGTTVVITVSLGVEPVTEGFVIITGILDGNMSGGTPKCAELYVNGTVDLTGYTIKNFNNGGTSATGSQVLSGQYTNEFVYVVNSYSVANFESCFGTSGDFGNVISTSDLGINGDDCVVLYDSSDEMIDIYGQIGVDGSGTSWEYKDGFARRLDGERPSSDFNVSEWSVHNESLGSSASEYSQTVPFGEYVK